MTTPHPSDLRFRPRLVSTVTVSALCVVAVAEGLLHLPAVREALPLPKPYYSHNIEPRKRRLHSLVRAHGGLDVLCLGSSIVRTNIRPDILDRELSARGVPCVSFNGGLSGLSVASVALYLDRFYLKQVKPAVVLQGIRLSELLDAVPNDYTLLVDSPLESSWLQRGWRGRLQSAMWEHVALLYYHGTVGAAVQRFRIPVSGDRILFKVDARGHSEPVIDLPAAKARGWIGAAPCYAGTIDDHRLEGGLACLETAQRHCRDAGVAYVLVNVPEHGGKYAGPQGREAYRSYLQALESLSTRLGIPFIDVTESDPQRYASDALFSDYHHMARPGSTRFSQELARRLVPVLRDLRTEGV